MLDRLLISLGFAVVGGATVYFLWASLTRRLRSLRTRGRPKQAVPADPPKGQEPERSPETAEDETIAQINRNLAELARAQVSIIERLEAAPEEESPRDGVPVAVAERLEGMASTLDSLAGRAGPEDAMADVLTALDGRLAAIEDRLTGGEQDDDAADRDAAMAAAMEALASRLEGVETGLDALSRQGEDARSAVPEALREVLKTARPDDALADVEHRLTERLDALAARMEAATAGEDPAAELTSRLGTIEAQLRAISDADGADRAVIDGIEEALAELQTQLAAPTEMAFSDEALAAIQSHVQAVLTDLDAPDEQTAALAETLAGLDKRLDAVQTRLDALATDRPSANTLEIVGAISTLQTEAARLKDGIESGFGELRDAADGSAERIAAMESRIATLETAIAEDGEDGAALEAVTRRLDDLAGTDMPASMATALRAELPDLAAAVAGMLADRMAERAAAPSVAGGPAGQHARRMPQASPEPAAATANAAPGTEAGDGHVGPAAAGRIASVPAVQQPAQAIWEREAPAGNGALRIAGRDTTAGDRLRNSADIARAEAALLRARPGLATVIGRQPRPKPNGEDG